MRHSGSILALAGIYFLAAKLGLKLAFVHASATAVWPPTGIALAAVMLLGPSVWPGIFLGAFLANVTTAGSALTSVGIGAGNTLEALAGAALVLRYAGGLAFANRASTVFLFALLAACAAPVISATIGVTSLALGGFAPTSQLARIWWTWWLGDAAGALIVGPLVMLWALPPGRPLGQGGRELVLVLLATAAAGQLVFGPLPLGHPQTTLDEYLCLPLVVWVGVRFGPRETVTCTSLLSLLALWGTLIHRGPFARPDPNDALLQLQEFMGVASIMGLALAGAVQEQRRLEAELVASRRNKAEAVGTLAAGVAHNFNNILQVVVSQVDLLALDMAASAKGRAALMSISRAGDRAAILVRQLLDFTRRTPSSPRRTGAADAIASVVKLLRPSLPERIELRAVLTHGDVEVVVDPAELEQAIVNLVLNARDSIPDRGLITVELEEPRADPPHARPNGSTHHGPVIAIRVRDSGSGMDRAIQDRLFEPFFTTKGPDRGTGLGLATVQAAIERAGGWVEVESTPGKGSCFSMLLPRVPAAPEPSPSLAEAPAATIAPEQAPVAPSHRTILVAEDEAELLMLLSEYLAGLGYQVLKASDGQQAVDIARAHSSPIHLALCDIGLPRLDGVEVARQVAGFHPETSFWFMSAHGADALHALGWPGASPVLLRKPFRLADLGRRLAGVQRATRTPSSPPLDS